MQKINIKARGNQGHGEEGEDDPRTEATPDFFQGGGPENLRLTEAMLLRKPFVHEAHSNFMKFFNAVCVKSFGITATTQEVAFSMMLVCVYKLHVFLCLNVSSSVALIVIPRPNHYAPRTEGRRGALRGISEFAGIWRRHGTHSGACTRVKRNRPAQNRHQRTE